MPTPPSQWARIIAQNPDHSRWYIERFRTMAAQGHDIVGEARLIDAMAPRGARLLDAGCGPGRLGAHLHAQGHRVVGVDVDPALIAAAAEDHPGPRWLTGDLAELDDVLAAAGEADAAFDVIVCAGNVMTFLHPDTRRAVLAGFARHLATGGRAVIGFGAGRGYAVEEFGADAVASGLRVALRLASWDVRPFDAGSGDFLVAVCEAAS